MYIENYKILLREYKDLDKWINILFFKVSILLHQFSLNLVINSM